MSRTLKALGGAILVVGLAALLIRAGRMDNSERPSRSQLNSYLLQMTPPSVGAAVKVREVNKGFFFGRSYSYSVRVPPAIFMESYIDFATAKGASKKMILDHGKNKRQIFCIGAISIDVEAKPDPTGSTVDLGAYWSSAREDPRYCRSALGQRSAGAPPASGRPWQAGCHVLQLEKLDRTPHDRERGFFPGASLPWLVDEG